MYKASITGSSYFLPEGRVTNTQLAEKYGETYQAKFGRALTPDTISKACGINERRYARADERLRDFAAASIIDLLDKTNTQLSDVGAIVLANLSPESFTPSNSSLVFEELSKHYGLKGLKLTTYDINAACSGFLFAVEQATNYVRLGQRKKVIVCGAEILSRMLNGWDYHTGILFGDGAAAVLIEAVEDDVPGINNTFTTSITDYIDDIIYYSPLSKDYDETLKLEGGKVYKHGTALTIAAVKEYLNERNLTADDFDYFIFHQSNTRMLDEIAEKVGIPTGKMLSNLSSVGNTAAASIPICLAQAAEKNTFKANDRVFLCSFGAGYTLGIVDTNWKAN